MTKALTVLTVILAALALSSCSGDASSPGSEDEVQIHGTLSFELSTSCEGVRLPDNLRVEFRDEAEKLIGTHDFAGVGEWSPSDVGCLYEGDYELPLPRAEFYQVDVIPEPPDATFPPRSFEELEEEGFRYDITF